jgi:hypothetical protein
VTSTPQGPGVVVVVVVLSRVLTAAERLRQIFDGDPHALIGVPLGRSELPPELAAVVRAAWAVAVGPDGSGPGAPAVIDALARALTFAEALRMSGTAAGKAIALPLRFGNLPRGLTSVARDAWALAVGLDDDHEHRDGDGAAER